MARVLTANDDPGEVADLLVTSVASVNSALQRARATLDDRVGDQAADGDWLDPTDAAPRELLARYTDVFSRYDMASLTALVHEDAVQSMPPYEQWLATRDDIFESTFFLDTTTPFPISASHSGWTDRGDGRSTQDGGAAFSRPPAMPSS